MATLPALALTDVLRALADAGASDTLLGQVVRELVVSTAPAVAAPAAPVPPPAMFARGASAPPVPSSVPAHRSAPTPAQHEPPADRHFSGSLTMAAEPVVVNFRRNGKRSSVYFTPAKWMELVSEVGNEAATLDLVKQYAAVSPDQGNRSAWVQEAVRRSGGMPPPSS